MRTFLFSFLFVCAASVASAQLWPGQQPRAPEIITIMPPLAPPQIWTHDQFGNTGGQWCGPYGCTQYYRSPQPTQPQPQPYMCPLGMLPTFSLSGVMICK